MNGEGFAPSTKPKPQSKPKEEWRPLIPPPPDAPRPPAHELANCDALHEYTDADDRVLFYVRRREARAGKPKQFFPLTFGVLDGKRGWHAKHPDAPRPLYGLNRLSTMPDAPVLICEGAPHKVPSQPFRTPRCPRS